MQNGIISVYIENYKKIEFLNVDLQGRSIWLVGDNEVGKSSFLQAVFNLLSNEPFPDNSITKGKNSATIETTFAIDGKIYTAGKDFNVKTPKGKFYLKTEDGIRTDKVSVLNDLIGNISFDPFEFVEWSSTADGRRKQVQLVRKLIPENINAEINSIDSEYKELVELRAAKNVELKDGYSFLKKLDVTELDKQQYAERIDIDETQQRINAIQKTESEISRIEQDIQANNTNILQRKDRIERLKKELAYEEEWLEQHQDHEANLKSELTEKQSSMVEGEKDELFQMLKDAAEHNTKVAEVEKYLAAQSLTDKYEKEYSEMNAECAELLKKKQRLVSNANLPIEGLTFDEVGIYLDGMPVSEEQISTSQIMEIGVKIQTALNPKLKILRIPRAESLGAKRKQAIINYCSENGFQLFAEKVVESVENLQIEFIES